MPTMLSLTARIVIAETDDGRFEIEKTEADEYYGKYNEIIKNNDIAQRAFSELLTAKDFGRRISDNFIETRYGREMRYATELIYRIERPCTVNYRDESGALIKKEGLLLVREDDEVIVFRNQDSSMKCIVPKGRLERFELEPYKK